MRLCSGERIDYIYRNDLRIIQSKDVFAFSIDAILLAQFVTVVRSRGKMVDLCSGNGAIPLVLSTRSRVSMKGVELQPRLCEMARRSVQINGLAEQIEILCGDVKTAYHKLGEQKYDVLTCNPPYFQLNEQSLRNENEQLKIARHEENCTLEDVVRTSVRLLKDRGKAAFVYRPDRLSEVLYTCEKAGLIPKRIQFVHPKKEKQANIVLIETVKNGRSGMTILPPMIVHNEDGTYSDQFQKAYGVVRTIQFSAEHQKKSSSLQKENKQHYVYILQCKDGSYYTGYTTDPFDRLRKHEQGLGAKYTRGRGPFTFVHLQAFATKSEAMQEEARIKKLSKTAKKEFIMQRRRGRGTSRHDLSRSDSDW